MSRGEWGGFPGFTNEAQRQRARRWKGPRLDRDDLLREAVLRRMAWGASPPQVSGHLALEMGRPVISHESIYRFIAAQVKRTKDYDWRNFLPKRKATRGRRSRKGRSSALFIKARRPLSERPAEAADRRPPARESGKRPNAVNYLARDIGCAAPGGSRPAGD